MVGTPAEVAAEIMREHANWRKKLFDLPLIVLLLARIKGLLTGEHAAGWKSLKVRGELLTRRRAIFVAAEAAGQIPTTIATEERAALRENLGVLVREGTSLHKVRALRALRLIPSEECIPHLEQGLRDSSPWVQATALHTLFRLNLREWKPRAALLRFLFRSFWNSINVWSLLNETEIPSHTIFKMIRGLLSGLFKERGGRALAVLSLILWIIAVCWVALLFLCFLAIGLIVTALGLAVLAISIPVITRFLDNSTGKHTWPYNVLDSAIDYAVSASAYLLLPYPDSLWRIIPFIILLLFTIGVNELSIQIAENVRGFVRALFLGSISYGLPLWSTEFFLFVALGVIQLLWIGWRIVKYHLKEERNHYLQIFKFVSLFIGGMLAFGLLFVPFTVILIAGWPLFWLGDSENWIVNSIRIRLLSGRQSYFKDFNAYLAYVADVARTWWHPLWARIRVVLTLAEVPIANPTIIAQLMDLADEDLPPQVKDAIYQVIDAAEKRIQRGQLSTTGIEAGAFRLQSAPTVSPGFILRPYLALGIVSMVALAIGLQIIWASQTTSISFTERVAIAELIIGTLLLIYAILRAGRQSAIRKWSLISGLGLLGIVVSRPYQDSVTSMVWLAGPKSNNGVMDLIVFLSTLAPIWSCLVGAIIGHIIYLLDADIAVGPKSSENRTVLLAVILTVAIVGTMIQSVVLQDYVNLRAEQMPTFALGGNSNSLILQHVPQDGRVIRVALVELSESSALPSLESTFPIIGEHKDFSRLFAADEVVKGEVWISSGSSGTQVWENLPNGCLEVASRSDEEVAFTVRSTCPLSSTQRLVAIVYSSRYSNLVRDRAMPANVAREFQEGPATKRLLANTLSLFVRAVWSPPLSNISS